MKPGTWQPLALVATAFCLSWVASWCDRPALAQFTSPPDQGTPATTVGSGSRPTQFCLQQPSSKEVLLAMAPAQSVGLTSQTTPTLWVYVPSTTAKALEFSLSGQGQGEDFQATFPVSAVGLMKITLPKSIKLTTGKPYQWKAALICDPDERTRDWVVQGSIQQQPLKAELQRQLETATLEQRVKIYLQSGVWYEALNTYLELTQTQPQNRDLTQMGLELLQAAGLSATIPQAKLLRVAESLPAVQAPR